MSGIDEAIDDALAKLKREVEEFQPIIDEFHRAFDILSRGDEAGRRVVEAVQETLRLDGVAVIGKRILNEALEAYDKETKP